jgi:DNA-directed RNA polymerase subunit RPC12/RpoP
VRFETDSEEEEAYRCRRCGKRIFGRPDEQTYLADFWTPPPGG